MTCLFSLIRLLSLDAEVLLWSATDVSCYHLTYSSAVFAVCQLTSAVNRVSTSLSVCLFVLSLPIVSGLSPDLQSMEQIRRIMRPTDVPDQGLLCDLLWSDPDKDVLGWGENDRGVSFTFGSEVVAKFLHKHDLDLICRAHQVITFAAVSACLFDL